MNKIINSQKAICIVGVAPVRENASHGAQNVTQLLFGDLMTVSEQVGDFYEITIENDGYKGFVSNKQIKLIDSSFYEKYKESVKVFVDEEYGRVVNLKNNQITSVTLGCKLPFLKNSEFVIENQEYKYEGKHFIKENTANFDKIIELAIRFLGTPYLWGGKSIFGIDCSGFTQLVYEMSGIQLPRNASQQSLCGNVIDFIHETNKGDLAFFDNEEGAITHVGIIIEPGKIIHASGIVKIDKIDHYGIYCNESGEYTHKLRVIKRIL